MAASETIPVKKTARSAPSRPHPPGALNPPPPAKAPALAPLVLGALGVVFGDIGTSPLYALRQCLQDLGAPSVEPAAVMGILSLIFWSLIMVVCVKYATFVLRADHEGEGGTLAMLALLRGSSTGSRSGRESWPKLTLIVLAGAALLYGDGVITPAISVLSAVEGIKLVTPSLGSLIIPISLAILVGLFLLQSRGTETVGRLFGPIMALWFVTIGVLGVRGILQGPRILQSLNPLLGFGFLIQHRGTGLLVLGGVVLCLTGAEALFADLSHFGRRPIRLAWYGLVLPALLANYFGEGALLLSHPGGADQPFFLLVPKALLWPMVGLATFATVIASQALISGIFTLTAQAVHMGFLPRMEIEHTCRHQSGQVYVGMVNILLMVSCAAVVLGFRTSAALGGAYGLSVIGTMITTSIAYYFVLRKVRHWSKAPSFLLVGGFLALETAFLAGNLPKIASGAWLPLALAGVTFGIFWIWMRGSHCYHQAIRAWGMSLADFRKEMAKWREREHGTGIFLTTKADFVPLVGRNHWLRELARHEKVLLVRVTSEHTPLVPEDRVCQVEDLGNGLWRIDASFGFMQHPDVTAALQSSGAAALHLDWDCLVCYLPDPIVAPSSGWWRRQFQHLYEFLRRNALPLESYFRLPPRDIVRIGIRLKL